MRALPDAARDPRPRRRRRGRRPPLCHPHRRVHALHAQVPRACEDAHGHHHDSGEPPADAHHHRQHAARLAAHHPGDPRKHQPAAHGVPALAVRAQRPGAQVAPQLHGGRHCAAPARKRVALCAAAARQGQPERARGMGRILSERPLQPALHLWAACERHTLHPLRRGSDSAGALAADSTPAARVPALLAPPVSAAAPRVPRGQGRGTQGGWQGCASEGEAGEAGAFRRRGRALPG